MLTKLLPAALMLAAVGCTDDASTVSEPLVVNGKAVDGRSVLEVQKLEGNVSTRLLIDLKTMSIAGGERVVKLTASPGLGCVTVFPTAQLTSKDVADLGQALASSVLVTSTEDSCFAAPTNSISEPTLIDGTFGVSIGGELFPTAPGCKQLLSDNLENVINSIMQPFENLTSLEARLPTTNLQAISASRDSEVNLSNLQTHGFETLTGRTCN